MEKCENLKQNGSVIVVFANGVHSVHKMWTAIALCSPIANSYSTVDSGTFTSNQPTP
jgi:hypothetical protein